MDKVTPLIMVSIDWPYGTEFCGIYSSEDLADEFIDGQVGIKYSKYGSYTKAMFSKTTVYLDDIVPPSKPKFFATPLEGYVGAIVPCTHCHQDIRLWNGKWEHVGGVQQCRP